MGLFDKILPTIATIIGGPIAGVAVKEIEDVVEEVTEQTEDKPKDENTN